MEGPFARKRLTHFTLSGHCIFRGTGQPKKGATELRVLPWIFLAKIACANYDLAMTKRFFLPHPVLGHYAESGSGEGMLPRA